MRKSDKRAGRQASRQADRQATGRQADKQAGTRRQQRNNPSRNSQHFWDASGGRERIRMQRSQGGRARRKNSGSQYHMYRRVTTPGPKEIAVRISMTRRNSHAASGGKGGGAQGKKGNSEAQYHMYRRVTSYTQYRHIPNRNTCASSALRINYQWRAAEGATSSLWPPIPDLCFHIPPTSRNGRRQYHDRTQGSREGAAGHANHQSSRRQASGRARAGTKARRGRRQARDGQREQHSERTRASAAKRAKELKADKQRRHRERRAATARVGKE